MIDGAESRNPQTLADLPTLFLGILVPPIGVALLAGIYAAPSLKALPILIAVATAGAIGSIGVLAINPLRKQERWWRAALWALSVVGYALVVFVVLAISWSGSALSPAGSSYHSVF